MEIIKLFVVAWIGLTVGTFGTIALKFISTLKNKTKNNVFSALTVVCVFAPAVLMGSYVCAWLCGTVTGMIGAFSVLSLVSMSDENEPKNQMASGFNSQ